MNRFGKTPVMQIIASAWSRRQKKLRDAEEWYKGEFSTASGRVQEGYGTGLARVPDEFVTDPGMASYCSHRTKFSVLGGAGKASPLGKPGTQVLIMADQVLLFPRGHYF